MADRKTTNTKISVDDIQLEPTTISHEVEAALKKLKVRKALGIDLVTAEMIT